MTVIDARDSDFAPRALIERKNGCGDAEIGEPNCKLGAEGDSPRMIAYFMATAVIVLPANKNYAMLLEIYTLSPLHLWENLYLHRVSRPAGPIF